MKRVTALLHTHRIGDIVHALEAIGEHRISVVQARGLLRAASARDDDFSVELGGRVTHEIQLDVFCDDARLTVVTELIRRHGHSGHAHSGWLFVSDIAQAMPIDGPDAPA